MCVQNEYITINSDIWYESKDTSETLVNLNRITPTNLHTFSLIYTAATADKHVSLLTNLEITCLFMCIAYRTMNLCFLQCS